MTEIKKLFTPFLRQCFVTAAVCINQIGHGCILGFPAVLLPQLHPPESDSYSTRVMYSWIASVVLITLFVGSLITPFIMGFIGRKPAHFVICIISALGWFTTSLASSLEVILLARIIAGLSFGMMLPLRSVLIGEYTSPKNRGALLTTISLAVGSGVIFVHYIGSLLTWHKTALIIVIFPVTSLVMTVFIPESPSFLVSKGKYNECKEAFRWLRGAEDEDELKAMIEARIEFDNETRGNILRMLGNLIKGEFYKPLFLMVHVFAITQLCGATVTANFLTWIIPSITNPDVNALEWMVFLETNTIILNTLAIFVMNKFNRRTMLFAAGSLCTFSMLGIAAYTCAKLINLLSHDILWIPRTLMVLHFFTISLALVPLPNLIAGEVFPLQFRSFAGTISLIPTTVIMFLAVMTFPIMKESIGISGTYLLYAVGMTYCLIVAWFLLPETKDRTLQDIEDEYRGRVRNNAFVEMENNKTRTDEPI